MSISVYPPENIAFSIDHSKWCPSLPSLVPCSKRIDHTEYGSAMETLTCPRWDKTWQSYWQTCIYPLQTLPCSHWTGRDRNIDIHMYSHMLMTWPHLPCPSPHGIGQDSTVPWTCTCTTDMHGCLTCPVVSFSRGRGGDSPVDVYTCILIWTSHGKLGHVWSQL